MLERAFGALRRQRDLIVERILAAPPEDAARGAALGMFAAFTPTIGIQIPIVIALWAVTRKVWHFNLPVAIACTFVTNVFTAGPVYYVFLVTGRVMMAQFDEIRGFEGFSDRLSEALPEDGLTVSSLISGLDDVFMTFGLPMLLGSLPWAIGISLASYVLVLRFVRGQKYRHDHRNDPSR